MYGVGLELGPPEFILLCRHSTVHVLQNYMKNKNAFFSQILYFTIIFYINIFKDKSYIFNKYVYENKVFTNIRLSFTILFWGFRQLQNYMENRNKRMKMCFFRKSYSYFASFYIKWDNLNYTFFIRITFIKTVSLNLPKIKNKIRTNWGSDFEI